LKSQRQQYILHKQLGAAEVWTSRQALQDLYQKMLVTDLEYALDKKVEQDLWNHAFKNQITSLQSQAKNRANPNRSEVQANLSLFLEAASGFYTQLLQELCTVFNVDLPCRVKSSQLGIISNKQSSTSAIVKPQPSSCSYICQHCLVHLGDIARYRNQTSQAESYYRHAAQLVPSNGQPYNQLAILASSKGDHLTTIFYYCRSIAVKFPFPAASTNLQKALSKALERYEIIKPVGVSDFILWIFFISLIYCSDYMMANRLILQKAFSSQQLVHITVINLFELHHLRDFSNETDDQSFSSDEQISWIQLLGLFMSFLGVMCSRALLNKNQEEIMGECPLPAIKVSLDWLKLRPGVFTESAVDQRQYIWPWLVSILNSFQPKEEDVSNPSATPLPEEFELQGFLALRSALRVLDFSKGHQGIAVGKDSLIVHARQQRLINLGKWVADNQPGLIQCRINDGLLLFLTDIPELVVEEPQEKDPPVLQESSNGEQTSHDGSLGLKSVLSVGKSQNSSLDPGERPVVTFKENIKPREQSREQGRSQHLRDGGKERTSFNKGNGAPGKNEPKKDGKRKSEAKKNSHEKASDTGKQVKSQSEMRKTPVSELRKTPVTQTQTTCSSQFIPIHHPGAFPPLPSRPGFPPPAYVIPPPVAFSMNPGFTFPTGVSVTTPFLQPASHPQSASQVPSGKPSHIPYSQQRPSGPGALAQGPPQAQPQPQPQPQQAQPPPPQPSKQALQQTVQLQVQQQQQQQQSPTKQSSQLGKSPPHHTGMQQAGQMWSQHQTQPAIPKMPMPVKQPFFMPAQDPMKLFEHSMSSAVSMQQPQPSIDKKMTFPEVKMQDFYWEPPYRMGEGRGSMGDRMGKHQPGVFCPDQENTPRGPPYEVCFLENSYQNNSIFSEAYGKNMAPTPKPDVPMIHQEPSLYSLFEGNPWSPSLPASSDHSTPASQSPHSSNPSSLPSSPPTHSHGALPFSNFGPIGTPDSRDRRVADRWKTEKTGVSGFGLDYLPTAPASSASEPNSWHQGAPTSSWAAQDMPMEDSSTVLLDSFKSIWSSSMMQPGPSALEQLLMQQKQKQQRGHGTMNPPH
uniref:Nonsense-mediated mRNA decay factor n=1 Tax=Pygocentrus nattereri TaxID=42514 RepID=A0A3B4DSC2_PYGNA